MFFCSILCRNHLCHNSKTQFPQNRKWFYRIEGRSLESVRALDLPILAVFSDGSVIDLHRKGSGACEHEFYSLYVTHGVLLDAREITALRIGDTVIPINE